MVTSVWLWLQVYYKGYSGPIDRVKCRSPCDDVDMMNTDVDATIDDFDVTVHTKKLDHVIILAYFLGLDLSLLLCFYISINNYINLLISNVNDTKYLKTLASVQ